MAYLCFSMWDLSSEDLKRPVGFEQLGWEIYILDCFFIHISGTLVEGWAQPGLDKSVCQGYSIMEAAVWWEFQGGSAFQKRKKLPVFYDLASEGT